MLLKNIDFLTALYITKKNEAILTALPKKKSLDHPFFTLKNKKHAVVSKRPVRVVEFDNYRVDNTPVFEPTLAG